MTYRDIVALVGVNLATVMRVKKLKQEAGSVSCGRKKKPFHKTMATYLDKVKKIPAKRATH